jgi:hypothetical protein
MELPDFKIPHAEKIEWMVEQRGWALEPVAARVDVTPPVPGYAYTVGFPERFGFPEVVVFGLTPVAANGLLELVAAMLDGGTEIPIDVELVGLFDNELRCRFGAIATEDARLMLPTAVAWRRGAAFDAVQLLWPDRNGFLPTEPGFDQRMVAAQPVVAITS